MDRGPQRIRREQIGLDDCATYLVSRGLAAANEARDRIENTEAGRTVGLIEFDPA